ncbi:SWIM zinc finger family protein [Streptomyces venezuelae]|uniref:SWIM zinc finger family protein n=1 Tax=Streptomyces venezuelae TaxID=54571 RepID=UPI001F1F94D1|nr:SWIM zinc finger family protein [Streptomyces venezuelae]
MTTPRGARGAAPRHDDRRRSFPQVAPREAPDGRFAATWWGNAWVEALEDTALDPARLARGKAYAGRGHVDAITVTPGRVVAYVHGSRPRPYRTEIRMRTLGDDGWERFLDEATARPDHIAALLDKDVPHALEAVAGLLPAPGDLVPDCSCPDDGYPCKHAAARAHAFLVTGQDPVAALTPWQDAVRLAAAHPGSGLTASTRALYRDLAYALDRTPTDLARAVAAWRQGGAAGLAVLEEPWDPPAGPFDRARPALIAADFPAFRPWRNRLSTESLQLRLGRDGLWYGYESDAGREDWWPRGAPDRDPVGALTDLLGR